MEGFMPPTIAGLPARLPFRDEQLMKSGKREGWMKLGGKEELKWRGGFLFLYWEVITEQDKRGMSYPKPVFVVESSTSGGSGKAMFDKLVNADAHFEQLERDNLIEIAAAALGIEP